MNNDEKELNNEPEERQDRIKKIDLIKEMGLEPFAGKFDRTHEIEQARQLKDGDKVKVAGRLMLFRDMGKLTFAHIQDFSGKIQIIFKVDTLGQELYKKIIKVLNIGDHVGVEGEIFTTQKGELSVLVNNFTFLSKALRPLPEKFHGLKDVEIKYRKRYLDLIMNEDARARFKFKSEFVSALREFYRSKGFYEIDTPVLNNSASGALAKPFTTHYNSLDIDVHLRIAPEIFLKEAIIGGFEKIFEVARVFRNEGMDASHLQDFTMIEHYVAYWDFIDNMNFTEEMLTAVIQKTKGSLKFNALNRDGAEVEIDMSAPWKKVSFRDILMQDCGIDIDQFKTAGELLSEINSKGIKIDDAVKLGRGNLIDSLYKKVSRPKLINPTFLLNHPLDLSPLARKNAENPDTVDRFQLVINGWEVVNAYSELIDPLDQAERFEVQSKLQEDGDEEAMSKDDDYVEAMEYGMPPVSGWGMGVERIVALLTEQPNLRDVVMFPLMKPKDK